MPRPLIFLGPNFSRDEAKEVRRLVAQEGRPVIMGWTGAHTPGQELHGDVVAIGDGAVTAEQDIRGGTFKRYASMDEFREAMAQQQPRPPEPRPTPPPPRPQPIPPQPEQPPPAAAEADKFAGMDRVQLIRYGAEHHPRKRQWALLKEEDLRTELRNLEAGD